MMWCNSWLDAVPQHNLGCLCPTFLTLQLIIRAPGSNTGLCLS